MKLGPREGKCYLKEAVSAEEEIKPSRGTDFTTM